MNLMKKKERGWILILKTVFLDFRQVYESYRNQLYDKVVYIHHNAGKYS